GDPGRYTQFQAARAIPTAAAAPGGAAGAGVGLGAGIAMGQSISRAVADAGAPGGGMSSPVSGTPPGGPSAPGSKGPTGGPAPPAGGGGGGGGRRALRAARPAWRTAAPPPQPVLPGVRRFPDLTAVDAVSRLPGGDAVGDPRGPLRHQGPRRSLPRLRGVLVRP